MPPPDRSRPWALVMWHPRSLAITPLFFLTRAEALAAAPEDALFDVVDITRTAHRVSIDDLLKPLPAPTFSRGISAETRRRILEYPLSADSDLCQPKRRAATATPAVPAK
ncbi:MAG: hypothetical protein QOG19_2864 [Mycobacterium sp.]|jgi:hypothetical protein|nr:hypothetical protein [Mycobacterium sp.]